MQPEVVLVVGYAIVLTCGAIALHRRGHRFPSSDAGAEDWTPHSEVPRLHSAVALVAAGAAGLLPLAALIVFRQMPDVIVLLLASVLGLTTATVLATSVWRTRPRGSGEGSLHSDPHPPVSTSSSSRA